VYDTKKPKLNKAGATYWVRGDEYNHEVCASWDDVFSTIAPKMLAPRDRHQIIKALNHFLWSVAKEDVETCGSDEKVEQVRIYEEALERMKLQFRALGLVRIDYGEHGKEMWAMTSYGEKHAVKLLAVHRTSSDEESIDVES
jgi:hypothetical protein